MPQADCIICELGKQPTTHGSTRDSYRADCERCGSYETEPLECTALFAALSPEVRPLFSEWVSEQNRLGTVPIIKKGDISPITNRRRLTFSERTRRLLLYLAAKTPNPGLPVDIRTLRIEAMLQTFHHGYIDQIVEYLKSEIYLHTRPPNEVVLTPKGIMQAEEWGLTRTISTQGFVAMWFSDDMEAAWKDGFYPAIFAAGYAPQRIDTKEHVNKICDEIVAEIRKSRFVVADFTGQRGGVYYEAGYAYGRDIPVIWTCRQSDLHNLHFDIRQYNCIDWKDPSDLARRLQVRIEAVIGEGPLGSR